MLGIPEMNAVLQMKSHKSRIKGKNCLPQPDGHISLNAEEDTTGFLGCKCTLLVHVQFFIHQHPQVCLHKAALYPHVPQPVFVLGLAQWPICETLHLTLLVMFTQVQLSSLSKSLLVECLPSSILTISLSLVSSTDSLKVHSIPLLWHWKRLNSTSSITHSWWKPLVSTWTLMCWPQLFECSHPDNSSSKYEKL